MTIIDISGFATLIAYLGMAFLVGFWLYKSRTLKGLLFSAGGVAIIYFAQASDRKPSTLAGILIFALVIGGLLFASWALVRVRRNRIHTFTPRERERYMARIEKSRAQAKRQATQAERRAPEVAVGERQPRQRKAATTTAPAQRERAQRQRSRGGYVVNRRSESKARAASLK